MTKRPFPIVGLACLAACLFGTLPAAFGLQAAEAPAAAIPARETAAARFDDYLRAAVAHDHFSGTVLVAQDGAPVFLKGYGMAHYELGVPNTADTVFSLASITKQFTAAAILQLQERGKLGVYDPVCAYLDDCPDAWRPITLHHLLTHSSGIPNYSSLPNWDEELVMRHYQNRDLLTLYRNLPLQFTPGTDRSYSNSGYHLLALAIERASGQRYGDYLAEHVFARLGMKHTTFANDRSLVPNRASGYYSLGTDFILPSLQSPTVQLGNAGIFSTVGDLLMWDRALYGDSILSAASRAALFTDHGRGEGYGWRIGSHAGRSALGHAGSAVGFSSFLYRFPDDRVTVAVLSNSDAANATRVARDLASIWFGAPYRPPTPKLEDVLWDVAVAEGAAAACRHYDHLRRTTPDAFNFAADDPLVELGYALYEADRLADARYIFGFTLERFPASAYSHDGLADIAAAEGGRAAALRHFDSSLQLMPDNDYAIRGRSRLTGDDGTAAAKGP